MAYLVLLSGLYYFIVVVLVSLFKFLSKLLFGILKVCCELSLVYMPVLFWMTFVIMVRGNIIYFVTILPVIQNVSSISKVNFTSP